MGDLTKETIEKIVAMADAKVHEVDGRKYQHGGLTPIPDPMVEPLDLASLTGLVDFLIWEFPDGQMVNLLAEVASQEAVFVRTRVRQPWQDRPVIAIAKFGEATRFPFGRYMDQEAFLIGMQVGFVPDETTAKLLQLIGTVSASKVLNLLDDGVTQQVTASTGLAKLGLVGLPNPVTLRPYRTFSEVEQPPSRYIVRAKQTDDDEGKTLPLFALFPVEDPSWQAQARANIAAYLKEALASLTVLA